MTARHGPGQRHLGVASGAGRLVGPVAAIMLLVGCSASTSPPSPSLSGSSSPSPSPSATGAAVAPPLTSFEPETLAIDATGTIYTSNCAAGLIYRVDTTGTIVVYAGNGSSEVMGSSTGDAVPKEQAEIDCPAGLVVDTSGNLLVSDHANDRIRAIGPDGLITTIVGSGGSGTGSDDGDLAGDGGPARDAQLQEPTDLTIAANGDLYFTDRDNHAVRRVASDGTITTVAGSGDRGFSGDGGPATSADLDRPDAVAIAPNGDVYLLDGENLRVRRVDAHRVITTVAGTGEDGHAPDGTTAVRARMNPGDLAFDSAGTLYVVDGNSVRTIDTSGVLHTFAGSGREGCSGFGGPAVKARITPSAIAFGPEGDLFIASGACGIVRVDSGGKLRKVASMPS